MLSPRNEGPQIRVLIGEAAKGVYAPLYVLRNGNADFGIRGDIANRSCNAAPWTIKRPHWITWIRPGCALPQNK